MAGAPAAAATDPTPQCKGTPGKKLRILSVDGGGVRGMIPAVCLEYLESQLQALDGPCARIADYFDVVAGTSTGGLIAAMLTAPDENKRPMFTAAAVKEFYLDKARVIFPKSFLSGIWSSIKNIFGGGGPKYGAEPLRKLLEEYFKELKVADALTDVFITTFDVKTQQPVFFNMHAAKNSHEFNASLVDVCLGTSAAPTYLPPHQFKVSFKESSGEEKTYEYNLTDGGIAVNNPAEVAILHALKDITIGGSPYSTSSPGQISNYEDILLLSLGTGEQTVGYDAKEMARWGPLSWILKDGRQPLIQMLLHGSSYLVDYDISIRFQVEDVEENYLRLQTGIEGKLGTIDNGDEQNMKDLVEVANKLLDEKAKNRNAVTGELEEKTYMGTNKQALTCFAVVERREESTRKPEFRPCNCSCSKNQDCHFCVISCHRLKMMDFVTTLLSNLGCLQRIETHQLFDSV